MKRFLFLSFVLFSVSALAKPVCRPTAPCYGGCKNNLTGETFSMGGAQYLEQTTTNGCIYGLKCNYSCPSGSSPISGKGVDKSPVKALPKNGI